MERLEQDQLSTDIKSSNIDDFRFDSFEHYWRDPKDYKKFEQLSKDVDVKNWAMKIFEKACNNVMKEKFEILEKENVKEFLVNLINRNRDLLFYISWDLWLPLNIENFADLNISQKLNFAALYKTINKWALDTSNRDKISTYFTKTKTTSKEIISSCNDNLKWYYDEINRDFKWSNISNFLKLKKTLKKDYGLTDAEADKYEEYVLLVQKHPEYLWILKPNEAGTSAWFIVFFIVWIIVWALWYHFIDNFWKWDGQTEIRKSRIEIEDPENVLRLITQEAGFSGRDIAEKPLFEIDEDDGLVMEFLKRGANQLESKKVEMEVEWKLALEYDAWRYMKMEVDQDTWVVYLKICPPNIIVTEANPYIVNKKNELIHLQHFDQVELELLESIKKDAIEDAYKDPNFLNTARQQTYDMLFPLIQSMHPYWVDVTGLEITYVDEHWNEIQQWPIDIPAQIRLVPGQ